AESARLESVCGATHRGFESHSLRPLPESQRCAELPERLGNLAAVERLRLATTEYLHHRREISPRFLRLLPVILDPRGGFVDLIEHVSRVSSRRGAGIERIAQLG